VFNPENRQEVEALLQNTHNLRLACLNSDSRFPNTFGLEKLNGVLQQAKEEATKRLARVQAKLDIDGLSKNAKAVFILEAERLARRAEDSDKALLTISTLLQQGFQITGGLGRYFKNAQAGDGISFVDSFRLERGNERILVTLGKTTCSEQMAGLCRQSASTDEGPLSGSSVAKRYTEAADSVFKADSMGNYLEAYTPPALSGSPSPPTVIKGIDHSSNPASPADLTAPSSIEPIHVIDIASTSDSAQGQPLSGSLSPLATQSSVRQIPRPLTMPHLSASSPDTIRLAQQDPEPKKAQHALPPGVKPPTLLPPLAQHHHKEEDSSLQSTSRSELSASKRLSQQSFHSLKFSEDPDDGVLSANLPATSGSNHALQAQNERLEAFTENPDQSGSNDSSHSSSPTNHSPSSSSSSSSSASPNSSRVGTPDTTDPGSERTKHLLAVRDAFLKLRTFRDFQNLKAPFETLAESLLGTQQSHTASAQQSSTPLQFKKALTGNTKNLKELIKAMKTFVHGILDKIEKESPSSKDLADYGSFFESLGSKMRNCSDQSNPSAVLNILTDANRTRSIRREQTNL
jgi:hypothetical protein